MPIAAPTSPIPAPSAAPVRSVAGARLWPLPHASLLAGRSPDCTRGLSGPVRRLLLASFLSTADDRVHQVALVALILSITGSLAQAGLALQARSTREAT